MQIKDLTTTLEEIIDNSSLIDVLTALELVLTEKEEHLRVNWQDKVTASKYRTLARAVYKVAHLAQEKGL